MKDHEVRRWMQRQAAHNGFSVNDVVVAGYRKQSLSRPDRRPVSFGILEMSGMLTVETPEVFLNGVERGFGRAKAFGCGLMLIYRMAGW